LPAASIKPSNHFIDKGFQEKPDGFSLHLSMELSEEVFSLVLLDQKKNLFLAFERHIFTETAGFNSILPEVKEMIDTSSLIGNWVSSSSIAICHRYATIVPKPVFNPEKINDYMRLNFQFNDSDLVLSNPLQNVNARNVFTFPTGLHDLLTKRFTGLVPLHFSTPLIESLALLHKHKTNPTVAVHVQKNTLQLLVFQNKSLRLYNSFQYQNEEEFIYFLLYSLEQLKLDHKEIELYLMGTIEKHNDTYTLLKNYVKKITFQYQEEHRSLSNSLGVPEHYYFALFNQHLCGL
jgi:hypothetical protein